MDRNVYFVDMEYGDANVSFLHFCEGSGEHFSQWHKHIFYELHFSFDKTVNYKFKEQKLELKPGEFLIIAPSVLHESIDYDAKSDKFMVISLEITRSDKEGVFYDSFINALDSAAMNPIKLSGIKKDTVLSFRRKELYDSVLGICELKMNAANILYTLIKKTLKDRSVNPDCDKAKIIIDNMIFTPHLSLGDIAEATNYSKRHISRIIKEQYGETFSQIQKRINNYEKSDPKI